VARVSAFEHIGVLGAGAWGTALANTAVRAGRRVTLWCRRACAATKIAATRENPRLPGVRLESSIAVTSVFAQAQQADAFLVAVPAQAMRDVLGALAASERIPLVACAKGIERTTGRFMTELIEEKCPWAVPAILSGPSFAHDVARGLPTAVTLASRDAGVAAALAHALGSISFRPYHSTDVRGVEIGGAAKNVLAIAAGIVEGRRLGASAAAALTARGFAELARFGRANGAMAETLTGLAGLGDLILTCSSRRSRNFAFGVALGEGRTVEEARAGTLVEGEFTASILAALAKAQGVDMPIAAAAAAIIDGSLTIDDAIDRLLTRPFRSEG
jgi:glycerol-3-phosphate dehydrogenase (NAD(P)+)